MNIILISLDSLRQDRVNEHLMPTIMGLADKGCNFINNYTVSNGSNPSHCSILTGLYPINHKVHQNGWKLPESITTGADVLRKKGYYNVGFVSLETLSSAYGLAKGFDKYFDNSKYDNMMKFIRKIGFGRYHLAKVLQHFGIFDTHSRSYKSVNKDVLPWIENNHDKKFFMFLHYFDLHRDTFGRENKRPKKKIPKENYDENVKLVDKAVKEVIDKLKEKNIFEDTLIIIMADHGENIFEKYPKVAHGWDISEWEFNTPLIMHHPKLIPHKKINLLSRSIDVMPTILELANANIVCDGKSLMPIITEDKEVSKTVILENYAGFKDIKGIKKDDWFYIIRDGKDEELYNDKEDYSLSKNIIAKHKEVADKFRITIQNHYKGQVKDQDTDEYTKAMLKKLGYMD